MRIHSRRRLRGAVLAALCCGACAPGVRAPAPPPGPGEIPALRDALAADSGRVGVRVRLAEAYRAAGDAEAAELLLLPLAGREAAADFHLGLIQEERGNFAEARLLYQSYLERGTDPALRNQVRARLALLERRELEAAVQSALAREDALAAEAPQPNTVGVFPFLSVTQDPRLRPLGTALAELLTTDLAQTDRLVVLERARIQDLLDEIELGSEDRVDPATAARSGRILGAANIVQGRVEDAAGQLALQAVVVRLPGDTAVQDPLREADALERVFDLEKRLALALYERMGVQLTAAERQRVTREHTRNVQALLAFGLGLEAEDAGRFAEAAEHFERAAAADPAFVLAGERAARAADLVAAASAVLAQLSAMARFEIPAFSAPDAGMPEWLRRREPFVSIELMIPDLLGRDPLAEVLGTEGLGRRGRAEIIIQRPTGGE
jgi:TolB-like protein